MSMSPSEKSLDGRRHSRSHFEPGAIVLLVAPVVSFIEFAAVGRLFATELILLASLPFLLLGSGRRLLEPLPRSILLLAALWLLGQIVTDLVRQTPFVDYSRGWAKIAFLTLNFAALYLLVANQPRRLMLFAIGSAVGGLLAYFFNPGDYAAGHPWKFGYGQSVTWLFVVAAAWFYGPGGRNSFLAIAILALAGALNIVLGFRSLGGICLIAAMLLAGSHWLTGRSANGRIGVVRLALLGLGILVASVVVLEAYSSLAASGRLGRDAQEKYQLQASGRLGIVLGGRSEILVSTRAILDSPFLGHGSWAKDIEYAMLRMNLLESLGYRVEGDPLKQALIPTHSHLFGAWVEAGVLGGLFWIWALVVGGRGLYATLALRPAQAPLFAFILTLFAWNVLFSPFGAQQRYQMPFMIICAMVALRLESRQLPNRRTASGLLSLRSQPLIGERGAP